MNDWLFFITTAFIIILAGVVVSRLSDVVARKTGLGGLWIGLVLVALVTSLPEVTTAASAGAQGIPDLSAGDLFGSGIFNLAILALADLVHRRRRLLQSIALGHVITGGLSIILTAVASIFILVKLEAAVGWVSWGSFILILVYLDGIWLATRDKNKTVVRELDKQAEIFEEVAKPFIKTPNWALALGLIVATFAIFAATPLMTSSAKNIAAETGLETAFFGTLFIALITSLPELVVSISAIRLGAFDMIVGNIFGSNAFNMIALIVLDVFYLKGSVFTALSPVHVLTALFIIVISTVAIMGLVFRSEKRYVLVEPDAALILFLCLISFYIVWRLN